MNTKTVVYNLLPGFGKKYFNRIEKSPIGYRVAKGTFWALAGNLISKFLQLLASIFVARLLGQEKFGALGMIQSTIGMFGVLAGFSVGMAATKHVAEFRTTNPTKAARIIALSNTVALISSGIISVILFFISPWLASSTLNAPQLGNALRIGAAYLFFTSLNGAPTGALAGFEAFKKIAQINLISGLIYFPFLVVAVRFGGLEGAIAGLAVCAAIGWLLTHLAQKKESQKAGLPTHFDYGFQEWTILWNFNLPSILGSVMVGPVLWYCNTLIINQPNGYTEMGLFNAANQWKMAVQFLPAVLGTISLPILSSLHGEKSTKSYRKVFWTNVTITFLVSTLVALFPIFFSDFIMKQYGVKFETGSNVLIILCMSAIISSTAAVVGQSIASTDRMWDGFLLNFFWAIALIISTYHFMSWGAKGLAIANLIAYGIHLISSSFYIYLKIFRSNNHKRCLKPG